MDRQIEWTNYAWEDLEQIADYIARDSEFYAAAFVGRVRDAARSLSVFAERGRVVPELKKVTIRELIVGNYRLSYRIEDEKVVVLRLIHGARDFRKAWSEQGDSE